ncbi:MAG: Alcohol dehydrogenase YqhD [candidate division BRC1 bacterium ADurb.BinA364]|nr:MAG: Alcohol dehydrogenase YqhD [candidate division BRC1 bacterium ADurb.BinA364]
MHPLFAVLDPETTYTLPAGQTANGIVDAFAHVLEQYMTYPVNAAVQDRFAEGLLLTLIEEGPKALARPRDYDARANVMWAATLALNGLIGCGVPQDWATHMIGHELTAFYGVDHAQSLAIVFPALLRKRKAQKKAKLLQYAERVWGVARGGDDERIEQAIAKTEAFFRSLGIGTRLEDYGIAEGVERVGLRFEERGQKVGERQDIDRAAVDEILALARAN